MVLHVVASLPVLHNMVIAHVYHTGIAASLYAIGHVLGIFLIPEEQTQPSEFDIAPYSKEQSALYNIVTEYGSKFTQFIDYDKLQCILANNVQALPAFIYVNTVYAYVSMLNLSSIVPLTAMANTTPSETVLGLGYVSQNISMNTTPTEETDAPHNDERPLDSPDNDTNEENEEEDSSSNTHVICMVVVSYLVFGVILYYCSDKRKDDKSPVTRARVVSEEVHEMLPKANEMLPKANERLPKANEMLPKANKVLQKANEVLQKANAMPPNEPEVPPNEPEVPQNASEVPQTTIKVCTTSLGVATSALVVEKTEPKVMTQRATGSEKLEIFLEKKSAETKKRKLMKYLKEIRSQ